MKNKVLSLVFCSAFILLSFTLSSFQQQPDVKNTDPKKPPTQRCEPAQPACTLSCPNNPDISCSSNRKGGCEVLGGGTKIKCGGTTIFCG